VTARPTNAVRGSEIVALPSDVQVVPFADTAAVTVVPARLNLTHRGAEPVPAVYADTPPVVARRRNPSPLAVVIIAIAWAAFGCVLARIMTPTFVQGCAPVTDATSATIVPSPVSVR
jgi:hypothetical protein